MSIDKAAMQLARDSHGKPLPELHKGQLNRPASRAESWQGLSSVSQVDGDGDPVSVRRQQSSSTNDVGRPRPPQLAPTAHNTNDIPRAEQMEKGRRATATAESKRHSWAARKQFQTVEEDCHSSGDTPFNRALSLDSGVMRRQDAQTCDKQTVPVLSAITIDDVTKESSHDLSGDSSVVYRNGNLTSQSEIDVTTLAHDPNREYDKTKYITIPDVGGGTDDRKHCSGSHCCSNFLRFPCSKYCCSQTQNDHHPCQIFCANLFKRGKCSCKKKETDSDSDDDIYMEDDPFRKRCLRAFLNFIYVLLALIAAVVTYSMIQDLITAMNNPVRSIHYLKVKDYDAPGISMYPGGAKFVACGHYYNNVVTSKVRTSDLDLKNRSCNYTRLNYDDPHYTGVRRDVLVIRGPTSFENREATFLHFELEDETRDFFTVSYFVFPGWDKFNASTVQEQIDELTRYHTYVPTFALSSGLRMWIKLIMSETYLRRDTKHTEFKVEYSVVKYWDRRAAAERKKHLFFIFFEWKNNIIEQSYLVYTTTPWSIGAGLCGVFLTIHRGYQLAQIGYKRARKDKQRRSIRKRTIRELKKAKSVEKSRDGSGSAVTNRKLKQQLTG